MAERFDIDNITKKNYDVGILGDDVISQFDLKISKRKIYFSNDKILYTKKHAYKFKNIKEYKKCVEATPDIIKNPDYIAMHPNGKSIEYIKKIDSIVLVAVRIKPYGDLWVKSVFPITQAKLDLYIKSGTAKKFKK
ncbi:hypothetical protein ACJDU8_02390 [Clostridium sp. WILCCON 0269]|uniref:Phage-Barnase-EndoU-ColicinE5/D-RelE like nuclease 3 domain-containing protein n=1 Tax=Candidatus Clostridium eludens TaxID=3381663 RepID=A0ABW8SEM8_9CLOT